MTSGAAPVPSFDTPVAVNNVAPNQLLFGMSNGVYESTNQGDNIAAVGASIVPTGSTQGEAIDYGGRSGGSSNPGVAYVGDIFGEVHVRSFSGGPFVATDPGFGGTITDVIMDPEEWRTAFAIDSDQVFSTINAGSVWADITGNLASLGATMFRSLEYVSSAATDALLLGSNAGVFVSLVSSLGSWFSLGTDLPNAPVFDLDYDATDDVLVAGTMGRGVWTLNNVTNLLNTPAASTTITLNGSNSLVITDQNGNYPDDLMIQSDTTNNQYLITSFGQTVNTAITGAIGSGTETVAIPFASVSGSSIFVNSLGGNDTLTVNLAAGNFTREIFYNGGNPSSGPGDSLRLIGGGVFPSSVYNFTSPSSGTIDITGNSRITYSGLEPIESRLNVGDVVLNYTTAAETITITPYGEQLEGIHVGSSAAENLSFLTPRNSLTLNGGNGGDNTVNILGAIDLAGASIAVTGDLVTMDGAAILTDGSGSISITAERNLLMDDNSRLITVDGNITLNANQGAPATGDFDGILLDHATIETVNGDVVLRGRGGSEVGGEFNRGVHLTDMARIESTGTGPFAGTIAIIGRGGNAANGNRGVQLDTVGTRIRSVDGDILIDGTGGSSTGSFNQGIIFFAGVVESTGAAGITLDGTGGSGSGSDIGVLLLNEDTIITSNQGDISIVGRGGGTGNFSTGVSVANQARVESTGTGTGAARIGIQGFGASGSQSNRGIQFSGTTPQLSTIDGDVNLLGFGGNSPGGFNEGIIFFSGSITSSGFGDLALTGVGSGGSGNGILIQAGSLVEATAAGDIDLSGIRAGASQDVLFNGGTLGSATGTGELTITADLLDFENANAIQGAGELTIKPRTVSETVGVGGGAGTLNVSDVEISKILDGFNLITIGDAAAGTGNVDIDTATFTDPVAIVGGSVDVDILDAGTNDVDLIARTGSITDVALGTDVTGGTVTLSGNVTPGQSPGILNISGGVVFANNDTFTVEIGGATPGTAAANHDQIEVTDGVTIGNNVTLSTSSFNGFSPSINDAYVLINNTGTNPVVGRFAGLPEGGLINNFLGTGLRGQITYVGGADGNDVILTVPEPPEPLITLSVDQAVIPEEGGTATITATLSKVFAQPVRIDLTFVGTALLNKDYVREDVYIEVAPGDTTGTLVINSVKDLIVESHETIVVDIERVINGIELGIEQVTITITDDDFLTPVIDSSANDPTNLSPIPMTANFGEPVTGFDQGDLLVLGGGIVNFSDDGGGLFSFGVIPAGDGVITVDIAADAAFDVGSKLTLEAAQFTITSDRTNPTPTITGPPSPSGSDPFTISIAFDETVTGFTSGDITVGNGSVAELIDNGNGVFTAMIDAVTEGTVTVDVLAGVAFDVAGNPNNPSNSFSVVVDVAIPMPIITGPASPTNSDPFDVLIDFGEPVTGFVLGEITVVNGLVTNLVDNGGGTYTATIDVASDGIVNVKIPAGAADDLNGNASVASNSYSVLVDTLSPIPVITGPASPTGVDPFAVTIDFGENVSGFFTSDIAVGNGTLVSLFANGSGVYTAMIDASADGNVTVDVGAGAAVDLAGNPSDAAAQFTVAVDTTAPIVVPPSDISVEGDTVGGALSTNAMIAAFLLSASATDDIDPSVTITHDAPALLPLGDTVVTFTAQDDVGNTATATATVTVVDTTAPILNVPSGIGVEGDTTGGANATNALIDALLNAATTSDIVDANPTLTHNAPSLFVLGDTLVRFTAADASGNRTTGTVVVTVVDTTPPDLTVPGGISLEGDTTGGVAASNAAIVALLGAATSVDIVDATPTITHDAPSLFPVGVTVITFASTDDSGNSTSATTTVTVADTTAPVLTSPAGITVEGDASGGASIANASIAALLAAATSVDIVDATPTITNDAPALFPLGDTVITFTATDDSGNTTSATTMVTVVDTTAPVLTAPADISVEGDTIDGAGITNASIVALLAAATSVDIVDATPTITHDAPALLPLGDTVITFTSTDDSGNSATAATTVTVVDTTAPVLIVPAGISVEGDTIGGAGITNSAIVALLAAATSVDIVDATPTLTHDAPGLFPLGDTVITFTSSDDSGNTATATTTVTVVDSLAPILTVPADISVEGDTTDGASIANASILALLAAATSVDIVDANPTITNDAPVLFPLGNTVITFTATDDSGNSATATTTVTVVDTTAPDLTVPADVSVEGDTTGGADITNATIAALLATATSVDIVDATPVITHDAPALFPLGNTVITFTATDDSGNSTMATTTVTVIDTTSPDITAPSDISVEGDTTGGADIANTAIAALLADATSVDIVDASPTITHNAPGLFPLGDTVVTFTATDDSGNSTTATTTVTVVDTTSPVLNSQADLNVEGDTTNGASISNALIAAMLAATTSSDIVDAFPAITHDAPALFPLGDTVITFTATDDSGNSTTATTTVTVVDTTAPDLTVPADINVEGDTTDGADVANAAIAALLSAATSVDIVDATPTITHDAPALFALGDTVITFTSTDDSGNSTTATTTVTVVDTTAPDLTAPADISVEGDTSGGADVANAAIAALLASAMSVDIVDSTPVITHDAPALFALGDTVITFTSTDDSGNSTTATTTVTVVDTTAPDLTAPADISVEGDTSGGADVANAAIAAVLASATSVDIVDPTPTITHDAPALFALGDTVITFTSTDDSGNSTTATTTVTVVDTTAPDLTAPADISVEGDTTGGADVANAAIAAVLASATSVDIVDPTPTITHDAPALFALGDTVITFTSTDDSGNSTTATTTVTVVDTTAPDLTAPADISVEGDTSGGADVANAAIAALLASSTSVDIVDATPTITNDAPALFSLGDTVITFTSTDDSGNSTTATTTVTVVDTTSPIVTAPTSIEVEGDTTGGANATGSTLAVFLASGGATDIVDDSLIITHDAPTLFPLGDTVVTFTTSDDSGNVGNATATVSVADTVGPALTVPDDITVESNVDAGAEATLEAIVAFLDGASATDVVDATPAITTDAPSIFPPGNTLVTFTATDAAGNATVLTATVTVAVSFDFGDAPSTSDTGFPNSYPVTVAEDGASHRIGALVLGNAIDAEADGQPDAQAVGDDNNGEDDEDGVFATADRIATTTTATTSSFRVIASQSGKLDAWIDFNRNGSWSDGGEQILASVDVIAGENVFSYAIPAGAIPGETGARFRLSSDGGLPPTGSATDGEVEDYLLTIADGEGAPSINVDIIGGESTVSVESGEFVVLSGQTELFRAPAANVDSLALVGSSADETVSIDVGSGFVIPNGGLQISGVGGENTLIIVGDGGSLDLTNPALNAADFQTIDLSSSDASSVVIDASAVASLAPTTGAIRIITGEGDVD